MDTSHVLLDVICEVISRDADTLVAHDSSERYDCDLGTAATYVYYHVAVGSLDVKAYSECSRHGLIDHIYIPASGMFAGVAHGAYLDFCAARGNADHHTESGGEPAAFRTYHPDHTAYHLLGGVEVSYDTVAERTDCPDARRFLPFHLMGRRSYSYQLVALVFDGHHARFVHHYLVIMNYDGIGRSQIHRYFLRE